MKNGTFYTCMLMASLVLSGCWQGQEETDNTPVQGQKEIKQEEAFLLTGESLGVTIETEEDLEKLFDSGSGKGFGLEAVDVIHNQSANSDFSFTEFIELTDSYEGEKESTYYETRAKAYAILGNYEKAIEEKEKACNQMENGCEKKKLYVIANVAKTPDNRELDNVTVRIANARKNPQKVHANDPNKEVRTSPTSATKIHFGSTLPKPEITTIEHGATFIQTSTGDKNGEITQVYTYHAPQKTWQKENLTGTQVKNSISYGTWKPIASGKRDGDVYFVVDSFTAKGKVLEAYVYSKTQDKWIGPVSDIAAYTLLKIGYGTTKPQDNRGKEFDIYFVTDSGNRHGTLLELYTRSSDDDSWSRRNITQSSFEIEPKAYRGNQDQSTQTASLSTQANTVLFGKSLPSNPNGIRDGAIFIVTDSGTASGTILRSYVYDASSGRWVPVEAPERLKTKQEDLDERTEDAQNNFEIYEDLDVNVVVSRKGYTDFVIPYSPGAYETDSEGNPIIHPIDPLLLPADKNTLLSPQQGDFSIQTDNYLFEGTYDSFIYRDGSPADTTIEIFTYDITPEESAEAPNLLGLNVVGANGQIEGTNMVSFGMPMIKAYIGDIELIIDKPIRITGKMQSLETLEEMPDFTTIPKDTWIDKDAAEQYGLPPFWVFDSSQGVWRESQFKVLDDDGTVQAYYQ